MNIKKISVDISTLTPQQVYALTCKQTVKMQSAAGRTITVAMWAIAEKTNNKGETNDVLTVVSDDGTVYGTISDTFIRDFLEIVDLYETLGVPLTEIKVIQDVSSNGRNFIRCEV